MWFVEYHEMESANQRLGSGQYNSELLTDNDIKRVGKWVVNQTYRDEYIDLKPENILDYITKSALNLDSCREKLCIGIEDRIAERILWYDMCTHLVYDAIQAFHLNYEYKLRYYNNLIPIVSNSKRCTDANNHYYNYKNNQEYKMYFDFCFDMAGEKQFWKWLGYIGEGNIDCIIKIVDEYKALNILLGCYMCFSNKLQSFKWMDQFEYNTEKLDYIRKQYLKGNFRTPCVEKLCNPLYSDDIYDGSTEPVAADII